MPAPDTVKDLVERFDCNRATYRSSKYNETQWILQVKRMLELHKSSPRTLGDKERLKREIESTDQAIDRLVYELNGLTLMRLPLLKVTGDCHLGDDSHLHFGICPSSPPGQAKRV